MAGIDRVSSLASGLRVRRIMAKISGVVVAAATWNKRKVSHGTKDPL
jgi:hypothetical protein